MNFDLNISQKRIDKQKLFDEMQMKKESFLEELTKFTIEWFEKEVLSTVKGNSEKVFELGEEKARELKVKINELKESSSELVRKYMDEEQLWWHNIEDSVSYYPQDSRLLDKHVNNIKLMFGELGIILVEYGLVSVSSESNYVSGDHSGWAYEGYSQNKKLKYSYGLSFSKKLYEISNEYLVLIGKVQEINKQIEKFEENKKRENIEEWWQTL